MRYLRSQAILKCLISAFWAAAYLQSSAQGIFSGGSDDGFAFAGFSQQTNPEQVSLFKSGVEDGFAFAGFSQQTNPEQIALFRGGNEDGFAFLGFSQQTNPEQVSLFKSGVEDGFAFTNLSYRTMSNFWRGTLSTQWPLNGNWSNQQPPLPGETIYFAQDAARDLVADSDKSIGGIFFNGSGKKMITQHFNISLSGRVEDFNSSSYIKTEGTGRAVYSIPSGGEFTFPVGNAYLNQLKIANNTGISDTFSVRVLDNVYMNGLTGPTAWNPFVRATWDVSKGNGDSNSGQGVDFTFGWNSQQEASGMAEFLLNHNDGSAWNFASATEGNPAVSGNTEKTLWFPGYKGSFSPFAISGDPLSPLPVELGEFGASCAGDGVQLRWITKSETNNKVFYVHRSSDLSEWEEVGIQSGAGNSNAILSYSLFDTRGLDGVRYYRLTQEDYDGKTEIFEPIAVYCMDEDTPNAMHIYPNPAEDFFQVSLYLAIDLQEVTFQLVDINGRPVSSHTFSAIQGGNTFLFQREGLASGSYFVRLVSERLFLNPVKVILK